MVACSTLGAAVLATAGLAGFSMPEAVGAFMLCAVLITLCGVTGWLARFGLQAFAAAICMGREAHPDPDRRYTAAVSCGATYVLIGLFGTAIAGLALLGTIGGALAQFVQQYRESHFSKPPSA